MENQVSWVERPNFCNIIAESINDNPVEYGGYDDHPSADEMKLLLPTASNTEINLAAQRLVGWEYPKDDPRLDVDFDKVADFRASHAYPLSVVTTILRQRAQAIDPTATVYARTKRMISILRKLERYPSMQA